MLRPPNQSEAQQQGGRSPRNSTQSRSSSHARASTNDSGVAAGAESRQKIETTKRDGRENRFTAHHVSAGSRNHSHGISNSGFQSRSRDIFMASNNSRLQSQEEFRLRSKQDRRRSSSESARSRSSSSATQSSSESPKVAYVQTPQGKDALWAEVSRHLKTRAAAGASRDIPDLEKQRIWNKAIADVTSRHEAAQIKKAQVPVAPRTGQSNSGGSQGFFGALSKLFGS